MSSREYVRTLAISRKTRTIYVHILFGFDDRLGSIADNRLNLEFVSFRPEADLELRTFRWKEQALYLFVLRIGLSENRSALFCPML
jgi:hypothetical protein